MQRKGVDISEFNGNADIKTLKENGIEFVIIRCGYGSDYIHQDDEEFHNNIRKCEEAGIPYGVYLYSYATDVEKAQSEVQHTLRLLNNKKPLYGVWYDVEDKSQQNADLVSICDTYCKAMIFAGYHCGIYSFLSWFNTKLNNPILDKYDKWVAQWSDICEYEKDFGIWQYTDSGIINGKKFDMNYAYKDYGGNKKMSRVLQTKDNQITNPFGGGHSGVDVVGYYNQLDNVIAHSSGVVEWAYRWNGVRTEGDSNSYGNFVKIRHQNGQATLYAHLASQIMSDGQSVNKGDVIGYMGDTGNSYGAHLHFEVRQADESRLDPEPYLNSDLPGMPTGNDTPVNYDVRVTADPYLNIRCGAGTNYDIVGSLNTGEEIHITHENSGWGKTDKGYISLQYTEKISRETPVDYDVIGTAEPYLNIRSGAGKEHNIVGELQTNERIHVKAENNGWGKTDRGYICLEFTQKVNNDGGYDVICTADPYLNIRSGAGLEHSIIGELQTNERIRVLDENNGWGRTHKGYIYLEFVRRV